MRRKQFDALKKLALPPDDWCAILGLRMVDAAGWREAGRSYPDPVSISDFASLCWPSSVLFEDGALDLNDVENYLAEDAFR